MPRLPLLLSLVLALIMALAGGVWVAHRLGLVGNTGALVASAPLVPDAPLVVTDLTRRNPGIVQLDGKAVAHAAVTLTQNNESLADTTAGADGRFNLSARLSTKPGWQAFRLTAGDTTATLLLNGDRALLKLGTDWQPLRHPRTGFGLLTLTRAAEPQWSLTGQLAGQTGDLPATAHSIVYIYGDETLVATAAATGPLFAATLPLLPHATIRIDAFDAVTARPLGRASVRLPLEGQLERVTAVGDPVWIWRDLASQTQDATIKHIGQLTPVAPAPAPPSAQP